MPASELGRGISLLTLGALGLFSLLGLHSGLLSSRLALLLLRALLLIADVRRLLAAALLGGCLRWRGWTCGISTRSAAAAAALLARLNRK